MGGKRTKKKQVQVRSIITRSSASRLQSAAPVDRSQEDDVSLQENATEESVRDENCSEKQVQVRTIVACSSSPAASGLASTASVDDPQEDDVSLQGGAADCLSRESMKGGRGKICRHVERGVTVDRLATQLAKSKATLTQCQDCIKEGKDASSKKSKARSARKKVAHNSSAQNGGHEAKKWVCLACGHVGCSSISTTVGEFENGAEEEGAPTGHAWKHSLLAKHPVAVQSGDILVCWCFTCNAAVDSYSSLSASSEVNGGLEESRDPLQQAINIVCDKLEKEGILFENPGRVAHFPEPVKAVIGALPHANPTDTSISRPLLNEHSSGSQRKRVVRGLMNLGNTCFFNSVMQNLLALDLLRNYFGQESQFAEAPLTSSLRRLYLETNTDGPASKASGPLDMLGFDSGLKKGSGKGRAAWETSAGAYNPRSLFGAICAKAPRFRGFQQQDSHELLRYLLEGLSSEEQSSRVPEAESRKITSSANSTAIKQPGQGGDLESLEEPIEPADAVKTIAASQIPTFVDNFFGGQLSSTVRCCECGHSSVVHEPILDLSLQIPSRQAFKKGRARAESSLVGKPENVPLRTGVKNSGAVKKVDIPEAPRGCSLVITESKQVSSEILSSASASEIGNASKVSPNYNTSLDDFGWLDFLGGGIQSAEGSLQGSHDVMNSTQNTENLLVDNTECSILANLDVLQSVPNEKSSSLHSIDGLTSGNREGSDESIGTIVPRLSLESFGTEAHINCVVDAASSSQARKVEELVAQPVEDDGPLPLASGILLLPYEPLQVPNDLIAEERVDCTDTARFAMDESPPSLQGEEKDTASSLQVEEDGDDFVGVSQLFDEDETLTPEDHSGNVREDMGDSQITEDSSVDSGWDADTGAFLGEETNLITVGSRKMIDHQDAIVPMSVEGCLAEFTKSELLSGDNAWECENCSRRMKETAPVLASSTEGNRPICYKRVADCGRGEKPGKAEFKGQCKDVTNQAGEGVSSSSNYVNGNSSHLAYNKHSAVTKGIYPSSILVKDGLHSEALSESWSHASSNGNIDDNTAKFKAGDVITGKVEANVRIGNGIARFNHLDDDQISGNQSSLCQRDDEGNTYSGQGNCMKTSQDFPPKESGCVEQTNGGVEERPQYIDKEQDNIDGFQSAQRGKPYSAQSSEKRHALLDFTDPGDLHFGTPFRDDRLPGSFRISGKALKSQKSKTRKSHLEKEKVLKMDAMKRLLISKAPPILTIHLKRFAQDMCGRLNKLSGHVAFPEVLDLRPFLDAKCVDSDDCIYQLVGIVEHAGTMRGGHYVAYVRGPPSDVTNQESDSIDHDNKSSWYYISDSSVHKSSLQAVLNSEAYLLFYEKYEATS